MKLKLLIICILASLSVSGTGAWNSNPHFPSSGRVVPNSFVINGKAYMGGGFDNGSVYHDDLWEYDPATQLWNQKANAPAAIGGAGCFAILGFGYWVAGWNAIVNQNSVFQYDPVSNAWTTKNNFPGGGRYSVCAFVINDTGFVGLGYSPLYSDFWSYNAIADSWSQRATFPGGARQGTSQFIINGIAYVGLGLTSTSTYAGLDDFFSYNPVSDTWDTIANFIGQKRHTAYSFAIGGKGYVGAGLDGYVPNLPFNDFYEYDPLTNSWTQITDLPAEPRENGTAFTIDSCGYIFGGVFFTSMVTGALDDLWSYCASSGVGTNEVEYNDISINYVPNANVIYVDLASHSKDNATVDIFNTLGEHIVSEKLNSTESSLYFAKPKAIYIYRIEIDGKFIRSGKFMN